MDAAGMQVNKAHPLLPALQEVVRAGYKELQQRRPELAHGGACLFLGSHFADPSNGGILMLGINPGGNVPSMSLDLGRDNCLLNVPGEHAYWDNAITLFNSSPELSAMMERATFSFCVPYRTESWRNLPASDRGLLVELSKPAMAILLEACRPRFIIAAGREARHLLCNYPLIDRPEKPVVIEGFTERGTYGCSAVSLSHAYGRSTLLQIPHLSRANSKERLRGAGAWLLNHLKQA